VFDWQGGVPERDWSIVAKCPGSCGVVFVTAQHVRKVLTKGRKYLKLVKI